MSSHSPPSGRTVWLALIAYSLVVSALHFGGLEYEIYTKIWWWDLLTHGLSGFGVAAWLCRLGWLPSTVEPVWALPLLVLGIGAGFEVYEYLFRDFYVSWTVEYYLMDTIIDLVVDFVGALAFAGWRFRLGAREYRETTTPASTSR